MYQVEVQSWPRNGHGRWQRWGLTFGLIEEAADWWRSHGVSGELCRVIDARTGDVCARLW